MSSSNLPGERLHVAQLHPGQHIYEWLQRASVQGLLPEQQEISSAGVSSCASIATMIGSFSSRSGLIFFCSVRGVLPQGAWHCVLILYAERNVLRFLPGSDSVSLVLAWLADAAVLSKDSNLCKPPSTGPMAAELPTSSGTILLPDTGHISHLPSPKGRSMGVASDLFQTPK